MTVVQATKVVRACTRSHPIRHRPPRIDCLGSRTSYAMRRVLLDGHTCADAGNFHMIDLFLTLGAILLIGAAANIAVRLLFGWKTNAERPHLKKLPRT